MATLGHIFRSASRRQTWQPFAAAASAVGLTAAGVFRCTTDRRCVRMEELKKVKTNDVCVGHKYVKQFGDGSNTPWLENEALKKRVEQNRFQRWDGVEGTVQEHSAWMLEQARALTSEERRSEWREYGEKNGCQYYIHDELTKEGGGYALVKIEASLKLQPRDMVAWMFDLPGLRDADESVVFMKTLRLFQPEKVGGPFHWCVYWCNTPGFPFRWRDGFDISSFHEDADGTVWQVSTSTPGDFESRPGSLKAVDRYWAYKLEPGEDGTTKTTLICQTILNGHIPMFISNRMICRVLIDYMTTIVSEVERKKKSGEYAKLLENLNLSKL